MRDAGAFVVLDGTWYPVAQVGQVKEEEHSPRVVSYGLTGGRRVLAPAAVPAREWSVDVSDLPAKFADARELVRWLSRNQTTFQWVSPEALHFNGLQSLWKMGLQIMPRMIGSVPGLGPSGAGGADTGNALVRPGHRYTFSVMTSGSSYAQVYWVDRGGNASAGPNLGTPVENRMSVTATPPDNAVAARIFCSAASEVASPCISESDTLRPVAPAGGCDQAVLTYDSTSHKKFSTRELMDYSFTVSEVL